MKKIIALLVILNFVFPIFAFADEYVLVMSKDDNVCKHMLKLYNDDFKKNNAVKYDQHEEFNAIKWEKKSVYRINEKGEKDYDYPIKETMLLSNFDINNDGKDEIVIKSYESGMQDIPSDQIYIFEKEENQFKDGIQRNTDLYKKGLGNLGYIYENSPFRGNVYFLKEIPPTHMLQQLGNKKNVPIYNALGGWFYFNPFYYDRIYYVAMTDWQPHQTNIEKWSVILKLKPDNKIKDVCYYKKAIRPKKQKKGGNL